MKANELRLGNYVIRETKQVMKTKECTYQHYIRVIGIMENGIFSDFGDINGSRLIENTKPIPLTWEILLKCGFNTEMYKPHWDLDDFRIYSVNSTYIVTFIRYEGIEIKLADIKYLHELQNLYFVITGKELEIKLQ